MNWKRILTFLVAAAALSGDALAFGVTALCAGQAQAGLSEASCCCGPDSCPSRRDGDTGLRSSCCDMRRPASGTESAPTPREARAVPHELQGLTSALPSTPAPGFQPVGQTALDTPSSLHAPPLYTLFRVYRI